MQVLGDKLLVWRACAPLDILTPVVLPHFPAGHLALTMGSPLTAGIVMSAGVNIIGELVRAMGGDVTGRRAEFNAHSSSIAVPSIACWHFSHT